MHIIDNAIENNNKSDLFFGDRPSTISTSNSRSANVAEDRLAWIIWGAR
jgi:hypothetical protein